MALRGVIRENGVVRPAATDSTPEGPITIEQALAALDQSEAARTPADLARWVVMTPYGFPLAFDIMDSVIDNPRTSTIEAANLFSERNAYTVARACKDGHGDHPKPVRLREAYGWMRECLRRQLDALPRPQCRQLRLPL